ncbi:MAG TPA: hypothetical protein VNZ25_05010 [Candidatus Angelobacter sp.]|nr:hypothetical protein [Candidatus Angelobacter sp.]
MRKLTFLLGFCCFVVAAGLRADTVTLVDGTSMTGDVLRFDDAGLMLRLPDNTYTNLAWSQFSQDSLKELSQNQKIARIVEPFIEPNEPQRPAQQEITVKPVTRLELPAHPSLIGGIVQSPVGLMVLLVLYGANLVAAFEIALFKLRKPAEVMGLSAILPVIGPIIFMFMGEKPAAPPPELPTEVVTAPAGTVGGPQTEVPILEFTHKAEEKKPEPQIYARGKFTLNKRFVETKFAGFVGQPKGDAINFSMELKTAKEQYAVDRILQVTATEVVLETVQRTQATVLLTDILEIKLIPKTA